MSTHEKPKDKYCQPHSMWKVKNAAGDFVCIKCLLFPEGITDE